MFGLNQDQWDILNTIASIVAAIGTVAAVVVSLWLAGRASRYKARLWVGVQLLIDPASTEEPPEYLDFQIVNTGERSFTISQIGWSSWAFGRKLCVQLYERQLSSPLPIQLSHGQKATWTIPLTYSDEPWLERFAESMLQPNWRIRLFFLRAHFMTTTGHIFKARPTANLKKQLSAHLKKLTASAA